MDTGDKMYIIIQYIIIWMCIFSVHVEYIDDSNYYKLMLCQLNELGSLSNEIFVYSENKKIRIR